MKRFQSLYFTVLVIATALACNKKQSVSAGKTEAVYSFETKPVWQDEFDIDGLPDTTKWSYDIGGDGWGNNEAEYYTEGKNANVEHGILNIEARKENIEKSNYTSARMVTKNKADFLYGRFEIKAKLPTGKGLWPAIWMLPTDWAYGGWPESGEIDIMEQVGYDPYNIHVSVHTKDYNHVIHTQKTNTLIVPAATTAFHLYRVDWTPKYIKGFVDNKEIFSFANEEKGFGVWPFDKRFHLLLNVAVGGFWGGAKGIDESVFPARMQVDYVRVYRLK